MCCDFDSCMIVFEISYKVSLPSQECILTDLDHIYIEQPLNGSVVFLGVWQFFHRIPFLLDCCYLL